MMDSTKEETNGISTISNTQINSLKTHRIVVSWEKEGTGKQYVFAPLHESNSSIDISNELQVSENNTKTSIKSSDDVPILVGYVPVENFHKSVCSNSAQIPKKRSLTKSSNLCAKVQTRFPKRRTSNKVTIHNSKYLQQKELTSKSNFEVGLDLSDSRSVSSESISAENKTNHFKLHVGLDEDCVSSFSNSDVNISHNIKKGNKGNKHKRQELKNCIAHYPQTIEDEGDNSSLVQLEKTGKKLQSTPKLIYSRTILSNSFTMEPIYESVECLKTMELEKSNGENETTVKTNKCSGKNKKKTQGHKTNKGPKNSQKPESTINGFNKNSFHTGPTQPIQVSESHTGVTSTKTEIKKRRSTASELHLQNDMEAKQDHLVNRSYRNTNQFQSLTSGPHRKLSSTTPNIAQPVQLSECHTKISRQATNANIEIKNRNTSTNAELNSSIANRKEKRSVPPVENIKQESVPVSEGGSSTFESVSNTRIANLRYQIRQLRNRIADVETMANEHTFPPTLEECTTNKRGFFPSNNYTRGRIDNQIIKDLKDKLDNFSNATPKQDFCNHFNSQIQENIPDLSTRSTKYELTDSLNKNRGNGLRRVNGIYNRNWSCPDNCYTCILNAEENCVCCHTGTDNRHSECILNELPLTSSTCAFYRNSKIPKSYVDNSEVSARKHLWGGASEFPVLDTQPPCKEMGDYSSRIDLDLIPQLLKKSSKDVSSCSSQSLFRNLSYATHRNVKPDKNMMPAIDTENVTIVSNNDHIYESYSPRSFVKPSYHVYSVTETTGNDNLGASSVQSCTCPLINEAENPGRPEKEMRSEKDRRLTTTQRKEIAVLLKDNVIVIDHDGPVVNPVEPEVAGSRDSTDTYSSSDSTKRKFKGEEEEVKMSPLCSLEGFKEIGSKIRKSFSSNHSHQDNFSMPNGSTSSPPPLEKLDEISEDISDQRKATDELFEMYKDVIKKFSLISGKLTEIKDEVNELGSLVRGREKKEISDLDINLQKANLQNSKPRSSISWRHTIQHDSFDRMTPFCMNIVNEDGEEEEICKLSSVIRFQKQNKTFYYKPDSNEDDDSDEYSDNEINEEDLEMETLIMKNDKFSDYQSVKNEMFALTDDSNIHDEPAEEEYISKTRNMSLAAVLENMINEMETNSVNIEEASNLSEQHDGSNDSESIKSFTYPESMRTIMANTSLYGKDNVGFQSSKTLPLQESVVKADAKTEKQNLPINMLAQKRSSATSMKTLTSRNIESGNRIAIRTLCDMNEYPDMSSPKRGNFLEVESSLEGESLEDFDITRKPSLEHSKCYCKFIDFRFIQEKDRIDPSIFCDIANRKKNSSTSIQENNSCSVNCCTNCQCGPTCNSVCKPHNNSSKTDGAFVDSVETHNVKLSNNSITFSSDKIHHVVDNNDSRTTQSNFTKYLGNQNTPIISYVTSKHVLIPLSMDTAKNSNPKPVLSFTGNGSNLGPIVTLYQLEEDNSDCCCCCSDRSVFNNELLLKCNALLLTKSKSSLKNDNIFKKEDSQLEKNSMQLKNMSKYYEGSSLQDDEKITFLENSLKYIVRDSINKRANERNNIPLKYSFSYHEQGDKWRMDELNCDILLDKIVLCQTQSVGSVNIDVTPQVTEIYSSTNGKYSSGNTRLYKVHIDKPNASIIESYNPLITYILLHNSTINSKQFFTYFNKILQRKYLQPYLFVQEPFSESRTFVRNDSNSISSVTSDSSSDLPENQLENRNSRISTFINFESSPLPFQALHTFGHKNKNNNSVAHFGENKKQIRNFDSTEVDLKICKCHTETMSPKESKKNQSHLKDDCESLLLRAIDNEINHQLTDNKNETIKKTADYMVEKNKSEMQVENISEEFVPEHKHLNFKHKNRFFALFFNRKSKSKHSQKNSSDVKNVNKKSTPCLKKGSGNQWDSFKGYFLFSQNSKKGQNKMQDSERSFKNTSNSRTESQNDLKVNCQSTEISTEESEISNLTYKISPDSLQTNVLYEHDIQPIISSSIELNISDSDKDMSFTERFNIID